MVQKTNAAHAAVWLRGSRGAFLKPLREALARQWSAAGEGAPTLGQGASLDAHDEAALRAWQAGVGLIADGVGGPCTWQALGLQSWPAPAWPLDEAHVRPLFPATKPANIARYLPYVAAALAARSLQNLPMQLAALATLRVESEGFVPMGEFVSRYNTVPGGTPFGLYEPGSEAGQRLGNTVAGDGARFKGRGFAQLRGRAAYAHMAQALALPELIERPELANSPEVAAAVLAQGLAERADRLRPAVITAMAVAQAPRSEDDGAVWATLRPLLNGGQHGESRVQALFVAFASRQAGTAAAVPVAAASAKRSKKATPATADSEEDQRRARHRARREASKAVQPDPADLRDRTYLPPPRSLAPMFPAEDVMADLLREYSAAGLILDQGTDGACAGFGLAGVVNHLRWSGQRMANSRRPAPEAALVASGKRQSRAKAALPATEASSPQVAAFPSVSARMIYTLARRNDEYAGEDYEGSSCRGALKGWHHHGVCLAEYWGNGPEDRPALGYANNARRQTLGVYYRIAHEAISDVQAAIQEVGAVYASTWIHDGWDAPEPPKAQEAAPSHHADLPRIQFSGKPSREGAHAIALVGYNGEGFVLQNSWGTDWGRGGFALLTYADWLANVIDAWVVSLGVPGVLGGRLAVRGAQTLAGLAQSAGPVHAAPPSPLDLCVRLGTDGRVSTYLTQDQPNRTLQYQVTQQADAWFRRQPAGEPRRLVLWAHSGLGSEAQAIAHAQALAPRFLEQGCFPIFFIWHNGLLEGLSREIEHQLPAALPANTSLASALRDGAERAVESLLRQGTGRALWSHTKAQAQLAFEAGRAGDLLVRALRSLQQLWGDALQIHLVGHSAGALALGHLVRALHATEAAPHSSVPAAKRAPQASDAPARLLDAVQSLNLIAPACSAAFANQHFVPHTELMRKLHLQLLDDATERDDRSLPAYQPSLLYLISRALENDARTPLMGMARSLDPADNGWDGASNTREVLQVWHSAAWKLRQGGQVHEVSPPRASGQSSRSAPPKLAPAAHASLDIQPSVMDTALSVIVGLSPREAPQKSSP